MRVSPSNILAAKSKLPAKSVALIATYVVPLFSSPPGIRASYNHTVESPPLTASIVMFSAGVTSLNCP